MTLLALYITFYLLLHLFAIINNQNEYGIIQSQDHFFLLKC